MRKHRIIALAVILVLTSGLWASAAGQVPSKSSVVNGSFETGDSSGWSAYNSAVVDSANAHSGQYCARLSKNGGFEQIIALRPNTSYLLSGWARSDGGRVMTIGVKNYGGPESFAATTQSSYGYLYVTFTTGKASTAATIYGYRQNDGGGYGYFDDISVVQITDPTLYEPLQNAQAPLSIPTYEGTDQPTHPSVVRFDTPWNGYAYWMAMTPYPFNDGSLENPSIVASADGVNWSAPDGVTNPLIATPSKGHNCDVDLVYVPGADELRMYYVDADDIISSRVKMIRSTDGVSWSAPVVVLKDLIRKYSILSPSIEILPDGTYMMWYIDAGNTGWNSQSNTVKYRTSPDGISWSGATACPDLVQPGYQIWHIDIHYDPASGKYYAIYPAYPNGTDCDHCKLFFAVNEDGGQWRTFSTPVLKPGVPGAWDDFCIYRSSFLFEDSDIKVWYGAKKQEDSSWHIGMAQRNFNEFLSLLEGQL